jgi:hypothetical protein
MDTAMTLYENEKKYNCKMYSEQLVKMMCDGNYKQYHHERFFKWIKYYQFKMKTILLLELSDPLW